jgi:RHS repeat-associated protein
MGQKTKKSVPYVNGEPVAMNRYDTATFTGGTVYLGKDALGSVRGATNDYGLLEERYEYDAFGKPYKGDLNSGVNLGYTGKPYDTTTGMYNYGYRDYQPEMARFTTIDPIRDGNNWFAYVNNDPVNCVDLRGLSPNDKGGSPSGTNVKAPSASDLGLTPYSQIPATQTLGEKIADNIPGVVGQIIGAIVDVFSGGKTIEAGGGQIIINGGSSKASGNIGNNSINGSIPVSVTYTNSPVSITVTTTVGGYVDWHNGDIRIGVSVTPPDVTITVRIPIK